MHLGFRHGANDHDVRYAAALRQLQALDDRELERLGTSRAALPALARIATGHPEARLSPEDISALAEQELRAGQTTWLISRAISWRAA